MKKLILVTIVLMLLSTTAHTAPISVGNIDNIYVANTLIGTSSLTGCTSTSGDASCDFASTPGAFLTNAELAPIITSGPASYALSPYKDSAYMDLGFDGFDLYNGVGNDLVVFIVGNATSFGLDVFDKSGAMINSDIYNVAADGSNTVFDNEGNWLCVGGSDNICTDGAALSAIYIDLGDSIAGDVALGNIRLLLGNDFNGPAATGSTRPRLSLAGGFYTEATIATVPLPLSAILFSSGLALLGWTGRKKMA